MKLHKAEYGTKKGIPTTLIAASSFDDIAAITIFGVCITLLFEQIETEPVPGEKPKPKSDIAWLIGKNFIEIFSGLFFGFLVAAILSTMNYMKFATDAALCKAKCVIMIGMSVLTPYLAYVTKFPEGKYIGIIFFGYGCNCLWKTKKQ
jgi:NhaP-type Na+/H+ or K+/H+ antiporter